MRIAVSTGLAKRKRMVLFAVGMIILAAALCLLLPRVSASLIDEEARAITAGLHTLEFSMWDKVAEILLPHAEFLNNPLVLGVSITMTSIAASLFVVTIFISVINEASKGEATLDFFLRIFIRIAITLMILMNINELLNAIQMGMTWMIEQIHTMVGNVMPLNRQAEAEALTEYFTRVSENYHAEQYHYSYYHLAINIAFANFFSFLVKGVIWIVVKIGAYSLLIEFVLRKTFMPIAFLGFMEEGMRSPGLRYLKRYIGMYFRIMIYLVAFAIADYMSASEITTMVFEVTTETESPTSSFFGYCLSTIIFACAASSFSRKGAKLVDEILGV